MKHPGFKPRKESLRDAYIRKLREEGKTTVYDINGKPKRKKPIKKVAKAQRTRLKQYYAIQREFLARSENADCLICTRRREAGEDIRINRSTEVHHRNGRSGRKLCDTADFVPSCFPCRLWPHENPRQARELGLLR